MSSTQISDDLWQHQDPTAARLSRRARRWLWLSALAALIVVFALPAAMHAGAFEPQVRATDDGWNGAFISPAGVSDFATSGGKVSSYVLGTLTIRNTGSSTVRVLDITVAGNGFRFDHAAVGASGSGLTLSAGSFPRTVTPRGTADFTLYFHITDCHAVSADPQLATIRVDSWRGIQTARVALPTVRHLQGGWTVTSPADPQGISSVRYLADAVCGIGMDPG